VTDGLDVVAVRIEDVAAVIVVVVPANAGCSVVGSARLECGRVEGVDELAALGAERDVDPSACGLAVRLDEERRPASVLLAEPAAAPENSSKSVKPSGASALS